MNFLRASIRQVMGCIILVTALAAQSQEFPSKPIRIISPFSAGSSTDLIARVIGQKITENTGQQVIVDTRPGANGIIGVDLAAKAAPDGYTIVLASNGTHGINVSLFNKLPYDPVKDFAPVTQVGHVAYLLLTSNSAPFNSLQDLVAAAKANPGRHTLGSAASVAQLTGELLKVTAGMNVSAVPYKTFAAAVTDLVNPARGSRSSRLQEPPRRSWSGSTQKSHGPCSPPTSAKSSPRADWRSSAAAPSNWRNW